MIIVAGRIYVRPGSRPEFLVGSVDAMVQARRAAGCADFVVAADPVEADRVNVFEVWTTRAALDAFRGSGPDDGLTRLIVRAAVAEYAAAPADP